MDDRTLPLGPLNDPDRLTQNPDPRWFRFTLRRLMVVVLVMAVVCTAVVSRLRDQARVRMTRTYPVRDLIGRVDLDPRFTTLHGVTAAVVNDTPDDRWAPEPRSVTPFFLGGSLIVRDNGGGHRLVAEYLERVRSRRPPR